MRIKTTAVLAAVLLLLLAVPASANHTYVGTARATGLELSIDGQAVTLGFAEAAVQSAASDDGCGAERGEACATGAGALVLGQSAEAHTPGGLEEAVVPAFPIPGDALPFLGGDVGAGRAWTEVGDHERSAWGEGAATSLTLTVPGDIEDVEVVQERLDRIAATLPEPDGEPADLPERLRVAVDVLREDLGAAPLAAFAGGATRAEAEDTAGVTTASATASGAVLVIGPTAASVLPAEPEGLIIIEVGEAVATTTTDQTTASASFTAAPVTVRVFDPLEGDYEVVEVAPGESACAAEGTPLETCVVAGDGDDTVEGAGAASGAAGVGISTLADPLPTLTLSLSQAEAAVASAPAPPAPSPSPSPSISPSPAPSAAPAANLPRTGADVTLPALALLSLGAAGWLGSRSRR